MSVWGIFPKISESPSLSLKIALQQVLMAQVGSLRASTTHIAPSPTNGMQPAISKSLEPAVTRVMVDDAKMAKQTTNTSANFIVEALRDIVAIVCRKIQVKMSR